MKEFDANITYQSNCHYQESNTNINISLPLKIPNITFAEIKNVSNPKPNKKGETPKYYNDTLEFTIVAKDNNNTIKWGNVFFYYIDNADINQIKQPINTDPIPIDINGNASIRFIPHNDGKIVATYYGEPYFESVEVSQNFILSKRPTYIKFVDYAPYLVNPSETIKMKVLVTDGLTNERLHYGLVTFLNYHTHDINLSDDGYEKVIGNPAYLVKGQAEIKYSPIQLGTNEMLNNIELIRASYNYDNTEYGVQWKYYLQHDDYSNIAIRRNNSVNIAKPYIANGSDYTELECTNGGLFEATENDNILLKCEITVTENIIIDNATVHFIIDGIEHIYENNTLVKNKYNNIVEAEYNNVSKCFEAITKMPKGIYTICAEVQNPTTKFNGQDYELPSSETNIIENIHTNNDAPIIDSLYLQSNKSESFYIQIKQKRSNINIDIYSNKETIFNGVLSKNDIYGIISSDNDEDYIVLDKQPCYFWIPSLNKRYLGTINKIDDQLVAKPNTDIELTNTTDYLIYIYLQNGIYSSNNISRQYETIYSEDIKIRSRTEPIITLRQNTISSIYPGNIQYIINGENLSSDIININILVDNKFIMTHDLTQLQSTIINTIPRMSVGNHKLQAIVTNSGYSINKDFDFDIDPASLIFELNNMSKNIHTGIQSDIIIGIKNNTDSDIGDLNINKMSVQLKYNDETQDGTIQINQINSNYHLLTATGVIYMPGNWQAIIKYDGDTNYNNNSTSLDFQAENIKPYCVNIKSTNDYLKNQIVYLQTTEIVKEIINGKEQNKEVITYESINQNILVKTKLIKDENTSITFINITDNNGNYTINKPSNITPSEWIQYDTLEYEILPYDTILNKFKQANDNNTAIQSFNSHFANNNCSTEEILLLYNQAKMTNYNCLFIGYDYVKDDIALWEVDDNGTN